jgi:hypothetical protein
MRLPSKALILAAGLTLGVTLFVWMGFEPYSGDSRIMISDVEAGRFTPGEVVKTVAFREGMTVLAAVREAGYITVEPTTHRASMWRRNTWDKNRAFNRPITLVGDVLRYLNLQAADDTWRGWTNRFLWHAPHYVEVPESAEIWNMELRLEDQIIFLGK